MRRQVCALELLFRQMAHPLAQGVVHAPQDSERRSQQHGETKRGHARAKEVSRLPRLRELIERAFEFPACAQRHLDLRLARQVVCVGRRHREHVVPGRGDHDEIKNRALAHGATLPSREQLCDSGPRGFDTFSGRAREEPRAERDDRPIPNRQDRDLAAGDPRVRGRHCIGGRSRRLQTGEADAGEKNTGERRSKRREVMESRWVGEKAIPLARAVGDVTRRATLTHYFASVRVVLAAEHGTPQVVQ